MNLRKCNKEREEMWISDKDAQQYLPMKALNRVTPSPYTPQSPLFSNSCTLAGGIFCPLNHATIKASL